LQLIVDEHSHCQGSSMVIRRTFAVVLLSSAIVLSAEAGPLPPEQCAQLTTDLAALDQAGIKGLLEKGPAATKSSLTKEQRDQVRVYLDKLGQMRFRCPNEAPFVTLKPEPPDDPAEAGAATAPIEAGSPGITLPPGVAAAVVAPIVPQKPVVPTKVPKAAAPKAQPAAAQPAATVPAPAPAKPAPPKPAQKPAVNAPAAPAAPATQPAAQSAAQSAGQSAAQAPQPARAKPAPKAKADDAFRPPEQPASPKP
jgi:hypothetical protein